MSLSRQFLRFFGFFPNPIGRMANEPDQIEKATFAMGCFWGPDGLFGCTPGVIRTRVGYTGGTKENPTYKSLGDHTEAIDIDYDPQRTNYSTLLQLFWSKHDPTAAHHGKRQYISAIYYRNEEEQTLAQNTLEEEQKRRQKRITTEILPLKTFYDAEDYHQKYRLQQHDEFFRALDLSTKDLKGSFLAARLNGYLSGNGTLQGFERELPDLRLTEAQANHVKKLILVIGKQGQCH